MNEAKERLLKFQSKVFKKRHLDKNFDGFDLRAYPETATGRDLDLIGIAIRITPRYKFGDKEETCEAFRQRILHVLATPDPEEEAA